MQALAQNTTARAHLYGAEPGAAARRRYWREIASAEALMGRPSPEAERLGGAE
jgi:hypothetical protein